MPFKFNGDEILPCEGLVKFNGVNVRELQFNGVQVHNGIWPPGEPTGLNATDDTCEIVELTWTDPVDPGSGTYIYDLYENGVRIAQNVTSPYNHTIRISTPRSYVVKSVGSDCPDPKASIADDGASNWLPDSPTGFTASNTLCEEIQFTWSNPAEDGFPNATYNVMQGSNIVAGGENVTSPVTLPLLDETLLPYHVQATNRCGSNNSNTENGQAATPPNPISISASDNRCGNIRVTFTPEIMTATYDLWQGGNLIANNISSGYQYNETDRSVLPHHLVQTGHCPIDVVNSNTNNGQIGWKPNSPTGFAASDNDTGIIGKVRCTWTNSSDNGNPNCTYDVYIGATRVGQSVSSGFLHSTSYDGNSTYHVKAVNACGSSDSNTDSGSAFQKEAPKTCTFAASGPCTTGIGHSVADICMIGGGGSGGAVSVNAATSVGGGWSGVLIDGSAAISSNTTYQITLGTGGASVRANESTTVRPGNSGTATTFDSISTAGGGSGGGSTPGSYSSAYNGNSEARATCQGTFYNGVRGVTAGDGYVAGGAQAGLANAGASNIYGGNGEGYASAGSRGSGGGSAYGTDTSGNTSGAGGGGYAVITSR